MVAIPKRKPTPASSHGGCRGFRADYSSEDFVGDGQDVAALVIGQVPLEQVEVVAKAYGGSEGSLENLGRAGCLWEGEVPRLLPKIRRFSSFSDPQHERIPLG